MNRCIWMMGLAALPALADAPAALQVDPKVRESMALCTDGKSHYVGIASGGEGSPLFYGDGKKMFHIAEQPKFLSPDWFFEPRFFNKGNNENFRGIDWRLYSHVDYDAEKKSCAVTCGEKVTDLKIVSADEAKTLLAGATFFPSPIERVPYALARDPRAIYYYVDRGARPGTEKSYHLWRGPKGGMKLQKMTDVASDSEGEIFATKTGSLRLILDKKQSSWVQGEKATSLTLVPVAENYQMIYNDLGVYTGQRLGTPCDDL
jgi:hypothetical protein